MNARIMQSDDYGVHVRVELTYEQIDNLLRRGELVALGHAHRCRFEPQLVTLVVIGA